jgi:hypothetical protein
MATFLAYLLWNTFFGAGLMRVVNYEGVWRTPLTFDHGYVLVWDDPMDTMITGAGTLALYAPDGHKLYATSLTMPDGARASAVSGAIDKDGTVALVYRAATKPRPSYGIVFIDPSGKTGSFIATNPYVPGPVCFAEDGSVWTTGLENPRPSNDFMTVRKFSKGDGQAGAFLPFSEVSFGYESTYIPMFHQMIGGWRVRAAHDRIGAIADGKPNRWLEFDFEGKALGHWDIEPHLVLGAFTSSGAIYAQLRGDAGPPALMVLDKSTGDWSKTGGTLDGHLVGADGEDLVLRMQTVSSNLFVWVRMRAQWARARE